MELDFRIPFGFVARASIGIGIELNPSELNSRAPGWNWLLGPLLESTARAPVRFGF